MLIQMCHCLRQLWLMIIFWMTKWLISKRLILQPVSELYCIRYNLKVRALVQVVLVEDVVEDVVEVVVEVVAVRAVVLLPARSDEKSGNNYKFRLSL